MGWGRDRGALRANSRIIQNVRKTGKDAAGQQWLNEDGVLTLASNPKLVITLDGDATRDGTKITLQEKKPNNEKQKWSFPAGGNNRPASPTPSRAESISVRPDNFPTNWFYIKSAASGLVVDIEHGIFTDPMKAGARAEMNHQKIDNGENRHALLELQLWRYEAGFLINRRTGLVLDIQGGAIKLSARDARNQHWFYENGFIANVYNSRLVLDIDGDGTKDGAKIAIGERKPSTSNSDQQWILEEARFTWLGSPSTAESIADREIPAPVTLAPVKVPPTNGWFYIRSSSSGHVVDIEQGLLSDPMSPNVLVNMNTQITESTGDDHSKIESQLWRYDNGYFINRRSQYVLDCKQGVVRYGARLMQGVRKEGKEGHHQRWEAVNGSLIVQGKPNFAIDIEGDGSKTGARLSLQRPKSQNNLDQQWEFVPAIFEWLKYDRTITRTETTIVKEVVPIQKDDWFYIKSSASGLVMDLEAGWITSATDVGAYISMKKQRPLEDADKSLVERQLWRYEDGYIINRRTGFVFDIYGRTAVVGVKLIQQHKALTEAEGSHNQLWNVTDGNIQLVHKPKFVVNVESNKEGSRVQLVELKSSLASANTWTLELAQTSWLKQSRVMTRSSTFDEGLEEAKILVHTDFPVQKWFYIKSRASALVLDVEHGFFRDHTKPGAYLELNNQKLFASAKRHALLELQLWRFENGFIINRRTGLVLDASEGALKPGTRLIQWTRKTEDNANQQWGVSNGFIHLKSNPDLVLDVDGDGTRDGARISLNERKDKKNLDQRWSFESVQFQWLTEERTVSTEDDVELLKEYETSHLARVQEHKSVPTDCWFYLKSGISDLVLEIQHGRGISHLKSGTLIQLGHQRLKSGKKSHALLELQLWRYQDGYIINRRSGLVLSVDKVEGNAKLIQSSRTNASTQRWVVENGVIRLAAHKEFALFLAYGHQGSHAFIRKVRQGDILQTWAFGEVHFSWLTLELSTTEQVEEEEEEEVQMDVISESEITYLKKEKAQIRKLDKFSQVAYFFLRASNGYVIDIEHGYSINHMRVGAYATVHPQTTAASSNQHALLDIQLWTLKDGYLINKRTGLALTIESDIKENARLIQALPKNSIKWTIEGGRISPITHTHLALNIRDGHVVLVNRSVAITWSVFEVVFSWLIFTEVVLLEVEKQEDLEFYEEFEEIVLRSSAGTNEVIEYAKTEQSLVAPKETWFYLVVGNKVASISTTQLLERGAEGATIHTTVQKRFGSNERHALVDLQLWKLEDSYIINRFTGLYLTVDSNGSLVLAKKQTDASRQQWQFSEDGSLSLISNSNQVVDFVDNKAVLVERSISKTVWAYDAVKFTWLTTLEVNQSYDVNMIEREVTEYKTVYTRYIQYLTRYTITTTTITRTRRIVRVHRQSPIQNATVLETDGTIWACHLVEAGTGVDYEMQLLSDNTKNVYYIYVQWGSTEGQLEGPYDSAEIATREFQEIFSSKIGIEWTEREAVISSGEEWTTVDFEYDTIVIESDSAGTVTGTVTKKGTADTSATRSLPRSDSNPRIDTVNPMADEVEVYKDSEVYHTILTQRATGIIYTTQLLYNTVTKTYYVYLGWGESDYTLDGPYETVEIAKSQFKNKYVETFGISWDTRKTTTTTEWDVVHHEINFEEDIIQVVDDEHVESSTTIATEEVKDITTSSNVIVAHEVETTVEDKGTKETSTVKEISNTTLTITKPAVSKETSWFRRISPTPGSTAAGAVVGVLLQVNGIWKRKTNVVTTRKAAVDEVCPIAKTSVVYFDEDVYNAVVTEKSTGATHVVQLIYNSEQHVYYIYYRWDETHYRLSEPINTIEEAKKTYQITYHDKFGVEWKDRETCVNDKWTYQTQVYEVYETIEEIEEDIDEEEVATIMAQNRVIKVDDETTKVETTIVNTQNDVVVETVKDVAIVTGDQVESRKTTVSRNDEQTQSVTIEEIVEEATSIAVADDVKDRREVKTIKTGVIAEPAVTKETSWFRRIASGAEGVASGALEKVDGVWKRSVQVLTTRKAKADEVAPIAEHSIVYYDDEVYDSVLVEKDTGKKHVTQLLYDTKENVYYVYYRWSETDYKLDGPHKTIEEAKEAFKIIYKSTFGITWSERENVTSERYTYIIQEYETVEEIEEIEEIVDEKEAEIIITCGEQREIKDISVHTEKTQETITHESGTAVESSSNEIIFEKEKEKEKSPDVAVVQDKDVKQSVVTRKTGTVSQPAVPKETSWFRRILPAGEAVTK
ncbi:hypothetical protein BX616_000861, partial [Lobosporangium transversale]